MKRLLLLFCLFTLTFATAQQQQTANPHNRPGLTEFEFNIARDNYRKLQESPDSKLMEQKVEEQMQMLNGLEMPQEFYIKSGGDKDKLIKMYTAFLTKNLKRTKFRSVAEGVAQMESLLEFSQHFTEANKGLYAMMGKATQEQYIKIVDTHYIIRPNKFWHPGFH